MSTSFTVNSTVLEAMLNFASPTRDFPSPAVLCDVLCEISPDTIRLVATDSYVLGILHLTPTSGYNLEVSCEEPTRIVLPVSEMQSLLKADQSVTVTLNELQAVVQAGVLHSTVVVRPGDEYPPYQRVLPSKRLHPLVRTAFNGKLVAKFIAFARALKYAPCLDISFHHRTGPASVRIENFTSFFGMLSPKQLAFEAVLPEWLTSGAEEEIIHLQDVQGSIKLTGVDEQGYRWVQFAVDKFAEQQPGTCMMCGLELQRGWLCGDDTRKVCDSHVELVGREEDIANPETVPESVPA